LSNNHAQNNFVDVATMGPLKPFKFLVGNPFEQTVRGQLVLSGLPKGYAAKLEGLPAQESITLEPRKLRVATLNLARPSGFEKERRTHDVVADVSLVIGGRSVGGISIRLAKANVPVRKPFTSTKLKISSTRPSNATKIMPAPKPTPEPRVLVAAPAQTAVRALAGQLQQQNIPVAAVNDKAGIVSSGSVPLTHAQLLAAIKPEFAKSLPREAQGRYLISFAVHPLGAEGAELRVSTRIIFESPELDSPLGGRLVPSNGTLEQRQLRLLSQRLKLT
jgi:hypothetical protein